MQILIIENNPALGHLLRKGLNSDQHQISVVPDGDAAFAFCSTQRPDLVVLDLDLPASNGFEVLETVLRGPHKPSVLVLTGADGVEDRLRCFELGAEDCVPKPFSFGELVARCRLILGRLLTSAAAVFRIGDVELDFVRRSARRAGASLGLTHREFDLLEYLIRKQGRCCSREELLQEVWQVSNTKMTNVIDVYITYLRRKLVGTVGSAGTKVIETVRGAGYRIPPSAYKHALTAS